MDVLRNDFSYLEGRTGLDLLAPLEAVAEAHDEVGPPPCAATRCACYAYCQYCQRITWLRAGGSRGSSQPGLH